MKRPRALALAACALASLASLGCAKKGQAAAAPEVEAAISRSGIVAAQGAPFYAADADAADKPKWRSALDFGATVKLAGDGKPKVYPIGGESAELIPVEGPEGPGWIKSSAFAGQGAEPAAVVAREAVARSAPESGATKLAVLKRSSLVAATRGKSGAWAEAFVVDPATRKPFEKAYILASELSFASPDLRAAILLAKAEAARDPESGRALLEEAAASFANSAFGPEIKAALGSTGADESAAFEEMQATLVVGKKPAPLRSEPSASAERTRELEPDEEVAVSGRTLEPETIDGAQARWYKVVSPAEGWVFGTYLEGAD
jgi:hypothetical protein